MENGTYLVINNEFIKAEADSGYWVATGKADLSENNENQFIGVWTNPVSNETYYDRSVLVSDLVEAIVLGTTHEQLAIYDIVNQTEVWLTDLKPE
jgi:hypothetical protein